MLKKNNIIFLICIISIQTIATEPYILSDKNAPASHQPTILKTPNNVLVIDITTPNSKGISINEYSKFNTPITGTILNNSINGAKSTIGGFINANPRLTGRDADLILNQVNSNNPSLLKGNLEIAGKRADIIIANPSGINIDGLNLINSKSSTFTTAKPIFINDDLKYLHLDKYSKDINIINNGLRDLSSDYTKIIANAININANINTNNLILNAKFDEIKNNKTTQNAPAVILDSKFLGGMYANAINLITTDKGVGVNNKAIMQANNIQITSNGDIINSNTISGLNDINIDTKSNLINTNTINTQGLLNISANDITNANKASISAENITINAKNITNTNSSNIVAIQNLSISDTQNTNQKSKTINNESSLIYAKNIDIKADNLNNISLNHLDLYTTSYNNEFDLTCGQCGEKRFPLSVNAKKIKDEIIQEFTEDKKPLDESIIRNELFKRVSLQDINLYVLNLQKNSYLHGQNSLIFANLRIDENTNEIVLNRWRVENHELSRKIKYSATKEFITESSLKAFIPSQIISSNDTIFRVSNLLNDKSYIYSFNDIDISNTNVTNISLSLQRSVNSYSEYYYKREEWKHKRLGIKHWVNKGGRGESRNINYSETGFASVFAAIHNITGSNTNITNAKPRALAFIQNPPNFKINKAEFNDNNIEYIRTIPLNTGFLYTTRLPHSAYMHNILNEIFKSQSELISSVVFPNKGKHINIDSSSLIYAGSNIILDNSGDIINSGNITAKNSIIINPSNNITNQGIFNSENALSLNTNKDIINLSGTLKSGTIDLSAQNISSTTSSILSTKGDINLNAQQSIVFKGSSVESKNDINMQATNNISIQTLEQSRQFNISGQDTSFSGKITTNISSDILASKNININSNDIFIKGSNLSSNDYINLIAKNTVSIKNALNQANIHSEMKSKNGFFSKKTQTTDSIKQSVVFSNIKSSNINISSNDISINASNLKADKNLNLDANNNINIAAASYKEGQSSFSTKKGFSSSKSKTNTDVYTMHESSNLIANSIDLVAKNDISIIGSNILNAKQDDPDSRINIQAQNNIIQAGVKDTHYSHEQQSKSSFFGLRKSFDQKELYNESAFLSNTLSKDGSLTYDAKNNLLLTGINIISKNNINLNSNLIAINPLELNSYKNEIHKKTNFKFDGILATSGLSKSPVFKSELNKTNDIHVQNVSSNLMSNSNINMNSKEDTLINGTNILANNINLTSQKGDILISASSDRSQHSSLTKNTQITLNNIKDDIKHNIQEIKSLIKKDEPQTKAKARLAKMSYENNKEESQDLSLNPSNLIATQNINIVSNNDINVLASNLTAKGDINLNSKQSNVNILSKENITSKDIQNKSLKGELSLTVQNEYAQIAQAALEITKAAKQLKKTKKEYENYKNELNRLTGLLSNFKQKYKNKEIGIDYSDIEDLNEVVNNLKDEDSFFKTNIVLASENLAAKTFALASQIAAAMASSGTYGFSVGINADLKGSKNTLKQIDTKNTPSILTAKNITINTNQSKDTSTNITGSNLISENDITIKTKDLNINASQDTSRQTSSSKELSGSISYTMYGGGGGSAGLNYSQSNSLAEEVINNNSLLKSGNNITINTTNDTNIKGANLQADNNIEINSKNLNLESQRDKLNSNSKSKSLGAAIGFNGDSSNSISANISNSKSNSIKKQTVLSSIISDKININVEENTNLTGSLILAGNYDEKGDLKDNSNLNLTTNTLSFSNLSNAVYNKSTFLSLSGSYSSNKQIQNENQPKSPISFINSQADNSSKAPRIIDTIYNKSSKLTSDSEYKEKYANKSSTSYTNNRSLFFSASKTSATIGKGNLIIKDEQNSDDTARLNREVSNLNKDLYKTNVSSNINAKIDHRLFTQEGRDNIKQELKDMNKNMTIISKTLPNAKSDNKIEAFAGKILNTIGTISLGIIPTNENLGGFLSNVPGYFGVHDVNFGVYGDTNAYNVYTNGIGNTLEESLQGADNIIGKNVAKQILYNPGYGFLSDITEALLNMLAINTGIQNDIQQATNQIIQRVKAQDPKQRVQMHLHSQANLIHKNIANTKDIDYSSYGAPMTRSWLQSTMEIPDSRIYKNDGDFVANPLNILNPLNWFEYGHTTEDYKKAIEERKKINTTIKGE